MWCQYIIQVWQCCGMLGDREVGNSCDSKNPNMPICNLIWQPHLNALDCWGWKWYCALCSPCTVWDTSIPGKSMSTWLVVLLWLCQGISSLRAYWVDGQETITWFYNLMVLSLFFFWTFSLSLSIRQHDPEHPSLPSMCPAVSYTLLLLLGLFRHYLCLLFTE